MTDSQTPKPSGKGRPTPSRKEREAANIRPIVGQKTPEAKKAEKARVLEERAKARAGMMAGEERYLGIRDKGPQRRMARDLVDGRLFTVGEVLIGLLFIVIIANSIDSIEIQTLSIIMMWVVVLAIVVDALLIMSMVKREISKRHGSVDKGVAWYAASRSFQMRPMRLPKPQVKRGANKK
ncbi:MAG: DUF3043 domain-containing protein [Rhodoluna sp.]|nr:DUF3043 domain-containing protein [Rhodoluna sp.]